MNTILQDAVIPGQEKKFNLFSDLSKDSGGQTEGAQSPMQPARLRLLPSCSANPLIRVATRLLNLIVRLRATDTVLNLAALYRSLIDEINFFETQALAINISRDEIIAARYCLCTALDEAAGQTAWGANGVWAHHSLLVFFHNETWGGEKYYQLLARLAQNPERHRQLIELLYYCNMLGFEGRFRIVENGHAQLEIIKRRVAALLNTQSSSYESQLSSHWQGVTTERATCHMISPWLVAIACAVMALMLYLCLNFSLERKSDGVFSYLLSIELPKQVRDGHALADPQSLSARLHPRTSGIPQ